MFELESRLEEYQRNGFYRGKNPDKFMEDLLNAKAPEHYVLAFDDLRVAATK
jgi:hypothetical protein